MLTPAHSSKLSLGRNAMNAGAWFRLAPSSAAAARVAIEIFPILGEAATTVEPCDGAFDDPTLG
jgi:hypothetical protein